MATAAEGARGGGLLAGRRARAEERQRERMAKLRAKSGGRYRVHYDIDGPRVRLGILWFVGAVVAFALPGHVGVGLYFGAAGGVAAANAARTWEARGHRVDRRVALGFAAAGGLAAVVGPPVVGIVVLGLVAGAVALPAVEQSQAGDGVDATSVLHRAGLLIQVTLPPLLAGACLTLLADLELWATISLVVILSAYEAGDYLIGSGSANAIEGPIAGVASALVFTLVVAALGVPPFNELDRAFVFGAAAAFLAPAGQLLGSVMLPHSRAWAPGLRRLDSYLMAAPLWYVGVDVFVL